MEASESSPETPEGFQSANEDEPTVETVYVKERHETTTVEEEVIITTHDSDKSKIDTIYGNLQNLYKNRYYWETFKSVIIFMLGLKLAQECYHIVIPVTSYEPFRGACVGRCRL